MSSRIYLVFARPTKRGKYSFLVASNSGTLPGHFFPCEVAGRIPEAISIGKLAETLFRRVQMCHRNGMSYEESQVTCVLMRKGVLKKRGPEARWVPSREIDLDSPIGRQIMGRLPELNRQLNRTYGSSA